MRTIIFGILMSLLAISCTDTGQTVVSKTSTPPSETLGNPPSPAQQGKAFHISTEAFYQANHTPSSLPDQLISLSLTPTHSAKMTTDYFGVSPTIPTKIDTGAWTTLHNGNLMVNLRQIGGKDSLALEFRTDGDKLVYVGSEYGLMGLVMWVRPIPES